MPTEPAPSLPVGPNGDKLHANSQTFTSVRLSIVRPKSTHARSDKNAEGDEGSSGKGIRRSLQKVLGIGNNAHASSGANVNGSAA